MRESVQYEPRTQQIFLLIENLISKITKLIEKFTKLKKNIVLLALSMKRDGEREREKSYHLALRLHCIYILCVILSDALLLSANALTFDDI